MKILCLPDKYQRAWDGSDATVSQTTAWSLATASTALVQRFSTDAHFAPYWVEGTEKIPRLKAGAIERLSENGHRVLFGLGLLDIDAPDHGATVPVGWRDEIDAKIGNLEAAQGVCLAVYHTRGGCRVLWRLPEPVEAREYVAMLAAARRAAATHLIHADELTDWQRLYRFPFVVRDGFRLELPHRRLDDLPVWEVPADQYVWGGIEQAEAFVLPAVIPAGTRHRTLVRYAASLRARGMDLAEIHDAVAVAAAERCDPPHQDAAEIDEIVGWAGNLPEPDLPPQPADDGGDDGGAIVLDRNSEATIARWMRANWSLPTLSDEGDLWEYCADKGIWRRVPRSSWDAMLNELDRRGYYPGQRGMRPICISLMHFKNVRQVAMRQGAEEGWFKSGQVGIAFKDRYLHVEVDGRVEWRPHSPDNKATRHRDWVYNPHAKPEKFLRMMREICSNNDDKLRCMLEFVGVSLLGHATAMQKVLVVLGTGGNGKSQYLDVVEGVFEPHERVCVPPQMMGNEYRRYQFVGASINLINEVSASRMRAEASAAFKAIVSGDHIEGRHIREMPVTFSPRAGHIMSANTLWMIEDESDGMFRRLMVVRLTEQFHESLNRVRDLGKSVLAVEHHDIFDLFVRHGIEALKRGEYTTPSDSVEEVAEWKRSQDPVAQWIHEEMEETPATHGAMSGELYATYTVWAEINGHDAISSTLFGRRLGALKIPKHKGRRGNHWGLRAVRMPH